MLESDLYRIVAKQLNIPIEKVEAYDKLHWKELKQDLNNPFFDVLEVPFLGSFTMTKAKMRSSLKYSLKILKRMKHRIKKNEEQGKWNQKLIINFDIQKTNFRNLWKLKQEIYK